MKTLATIFARSEPANRLRRAILLMLLGPLLRAALVFGPGPCLAIAQSTAGMPSNWDARIPLPSRVTLLSSTTPKNGSAYTAEFLAPRGYVDLVDFYESELPKARFKMGKKLALPKRKIYKRRFSDGNVRTKW